MNKPIYYRLIALWVLCEAMLGGIIHGFKIPVSGLVVGSCAIVCICLIAWYVPKKGAILKATIIVAIFKMMLSPQAPPPAYIAVFFQGLMGEALFWNRKFYRLSCILLAVLGLLESGLQRILMLTIVYGNDLWKVVNNFFNGLTKQKQTTNYSLLIGGGYVALHFITGILVGWWASLLPKRIEKWNSDKQYHTIITHTDNLSLPAKQKKKKGLKKGLFIVWLLLIALYVQSYFKIGQPLLPSHISLKILLRSLIIVLGWIFIIGPLLTQLLHRWLKKKQMKSQPEIQEVLRLLPVTQQLIARSWKQSSANKGWKRINTWSKMVLVNAMNPQPDKKIYILTAPVQTGKTTSLIKWAEKRDDVHGILTPVVNGARFFMNMHNRQLFAMGAKKEETEVLTVGRFVFSKTNFEKAIQIIRDSIHKEGWLVIDEIGPMELRGEGFSDVLKEVLANRKGNILLVIRDKDAIVEQVKEKFAMNDVLLINNIAMLN
jgi:nucleoside-triphosphatase THEP1/ABC-type thiamin/hydroxymethylpyrimidine transport system permease subunit